MSEEYPHEQAINMNVVVPSRRERLRRPLPSPPVADPSNRGSMGGGAAVAAAAAGVRGVVASRLAAMASAGSTTTTATNGVISSDQSSQQHKLSGSYSVDSGASSRIPSYRLSSLDRLAQRQRLFESGSSPAPPTSSATNGTTPSLNVDPSVALVS